MGQCIRKNGPRKNKSIDSLPFQQERISYEINENTEESIEVLEEIIPENKFENFLNETIQLEFKESAPFEHIKTINGEPSLKEADIGSIIEFSQNSDSEIPAPKKLSHFEEALKDGFDDDLELLNKCADVVRPKVYLYRSTDAKKLPFANDEIKRSVLCNKDSKLNTLNRNKAGELPCIPEKLKGDKIRDIEFSDNLKSIEAEFDEVKIAGKNSIENVNEFGDVKIETLENPMESYSKMHALQKHKIKRLGERKKRHKKSHLNVKPHERIIQLPIPGFVDNLNRNDSGHEVEELEQKESCIDLVKAREILAH